MGLKRKITILTAIGIIFFSCSQKAPADSAVMTDVLTDIMILEAGNQVQYNFGTIPNRVWKRDYQQVCTKYKMDTTTFKTAMNWYSDHPEQFSKIMEQVISRLQRRQLEPQKANP